MLPSSSLPAPSSLQTLFSTHPPPPPISSSASAKALHHISLQIAHNLRYQHLWTHVRLHLPSSPEQQRPLISGLPPEKLYVHPDEQVALLRGKKKEEGEEEETRSGVRREWVLPSSVREKWSLKRFGEAFEAIAAGKGEAVELFRGGGEGEEGEDAGEEADGKRLVLATLEDDSTVVYYIVHDGVVKPRQN